MICISIIYIVAINVTFVSVRVKNEQFLEKPKLGGPELADKFKLKIEEAAEDKFNGFNAENDRKRNAFIVSTRV